MATIETSLQLYDGATPVLQQIKSSIEIAKSSLISLQQVSGQVFSVDQWQNAAERLEYIDVEFREIENSVGAIEQKNEKLNNSIDKGKQKVIKLKEIWEKVSKAINKAGIDTEPEDIFNRAVESQKAGNTIQAKTGIKGKRLDMANDSVKNLYMDNMGENLNDVANSLAAVNQITGRTGVGLEQMTRASMLLRDSLGLDLTKSIRAAEIMERQFGISGTEAFDLIVQGVQSGLNKNNDLLDVLEKYSGHFQGLGFSSTEMFNMLSNGVDSGGFSVDKLGNAIKEFSTSALNGSDSAREGFKALGLDADYMISTFGQGGDASKDAFQQTIDAISRLDDPVKKNLAGTKLFGTTWKDLGEAGIMALGNINGSAQLTTENLNQLNSVKYDDAKSALSSLARTINMGISGAVGGAVRSLTGFITDFTTGLQGNAGEIQGIFGAIGFVIGAIGSFIADYWSVIEPLIGGIIAALIVYNSTAGIAWLTTIKSTVAAIKNSIATGLLTTAQNKLNAAFAANPVMIIIMAVIALIAIFYAVIGLINQITGTTISATGIICGVLGIIAGVIQNLFYGVLTLVFGVLEFLYNGWIAFANFFANVFSDPVGSVIHLFADLGDRVLGVIQKIAEAIDFVFGSNLADTVSGWRDGLAELTDSAIEKYGNGSYEEKFEKLDFDKVMSEAGVSLERVNYKDRYKGGYDFGKGIGDYMGGMLDSSKNPFEGINKKLPYDHDGGSGVPNEWQGISDNTGDTAANTAAMANTMDIIDEDLKYMRDAAEQEIINRFTLAELKIDMTNNNTLKTETDFSRMSGMLNQITGEILATAAEGGHI